MAYMKDPSVDEDADSGVAVVRNSTKFGPLSVSWRWMSVCGAFGNGKDTSIGACGASPLAAFVVIALYSLGTVVRMIKRL